MDNVHFIWMHKTIKNLDKQKHEIYLCWIGSGGHEVRGGRILQTFSDSEHQTTIFNLQNMLWSLKNSLLICWQISQITDWIYYITLTLSFCFLCPSLFFFSPLFTHCQFGRNYNQSINRYLKLQTEFHVEFIFMWLIFVFMFLFSFFFNLIFSPTVGGWSSNVV